MPRPSKPREVGSVGYEPIVIEPVYDDDIPELVDREVEKEMRDSVNRKDKAFAESLEREQKKFEQDELGIEPNQDPQGQVWLDQLRAPIPKDKIKYREERWGDAAYVEWHTVADILDRVLGGNWNFDINELYLSGNKIVVCRGTLAVRLGEDEDVAYVARSGVGIGELIGDKSSNYDNAFKTAASDCLKRCAVMYGVARDLYVDPPQQEKPSRDASFFDDRKREPATYAPPNRSADFRSGQREIREPGAPISEKQVGLLRVLGRKARIDVDEECAHKYDKDVIDLNKAEASEFITYMKEMAGEE